MPLYHFSLSPHRSQRSCTLSLFKPISISMARFQRVVANSSLLLTVALLLGFSEAKEILVGGKTDAWKIPSSQSDSLNNWAESARFRIGDFLGTSSFLNIVSFNVTLQCISNIITTLFFLMCQCGSTIVKRTRCCK